MPEPALRLPAHTAPARWGRLLSVEDAAEYLGLSATTLRSLPIASKPVGRRRLYDIRDLDRWADLIGVEDPGVEGAPAGPGAADPAEAAAEEERRFFAKRAQRGADRT